MFDVRYRSWWLVVVGRWLLVVGRWLLAGYDNMNKLYQKGMWEHKVIRGHEIVYCCHLCDQKRRDDRRIIITRRRRRRRRTRRASRSGRGRQTRNRRQITI